MRAGTLFVLGIMIGAIVGFAGGYWYMEAKVDEAYQAGIAYGQTLAPTPEVPASLSLSLATGTFDHSATVASDGSVSTETSKTDTLTIENTDESRTAEGVKILLYNPITGKEGLHDNLETDATEVSVTIGGITAKLYHNGEYTDGIEIGDIPAGGEVQVTVTFTLEQAVAGTFQDGQTYTCYLYVYQPNANYCDVVSFTVTT